MTESTTKVLRKMYTSTLRSTKWYIINSDRQEDNSNSEFGPASISDAHDRLSS